MKNMKHYAELGIQTPLDGIIITSGSITKRPVGKHIRYSSTSLDENDARGINSWGKLRVIAAKQMATDFPFVPLVPLSRSANNDSPYSDAEVMQQELLRLGVKNPINIRPHPIDSFSEVLEAVKTVVAKGWLSITILTTTFQKIRMEAMLYSILHINESAEKQKVEQILRFNKKRFNKDVKPARQRDLKKIDASYKFILDHRGELGALHIQIVAAEDIAPLRHYRYAAAVANGRQHEVYKKKMIQDTNAALQWRAGEYGRG